MVKQLTETELKKILHDGKNHSFIQRNGKRTLDGVEVVIGEQRLVAKPRGKTGFTVSIKNVFKKQED